MRVEELRLALEGVRGVLATVGAAAAERDLARVIALISAQGDRDLDEYVKELRKEIETVVDSTRPELSSYVASLKAAGFDEAAFKDVLDDIDRSVTIKKEHALKIATEYGVIRLDTRSRAKIIESIEKHFYWLLYQRDAGELAKRATPW